MSDQSLQIPHNPKNLPRCETLLPVLSIPKITNGNYKVESKKTVAEMAEQDGTVTGNKIFLGANDSQVSAFNLVQAKKHRRRQNNYSFHNLKQSESLSLGLESHQQTHYGETNAEQSPKTRD